MPNKKVVQQPADTEDNSVLEKAIKRYTDSAEYQKDNWEAKWDRDEKLYDSERWMEKYEGMTDTFVPMVFPTIETMVTALTNATLRFDYKSSNPINTKSAAPLNAQVDEWWDEEGWDIAIEEGSREFLKKGMAGFMWSWEMDRPCLEWYSMADMIVDPTIKRPKQLQQPGAYAGRRYYIRKGALDDYEVVDTDPNSPTYGDMKKRYNIPEDTGSAPEKDDDKAKVEEMYKGSTLKDASEQQDEIIEIWDVDRVVTILNRKHVIEDVENPYKARHRMQLEQKYMDAIEPTGEAPEDAEKALKEAKSRAAAEAKGVVPFFFFRNYRKISLFYADSETNSIAKEQERLNDMTNMETDTIIKSLAAQRELDPQYEDFIDLVNRDPDTVYPFTPGSLKEIETQPISPNSFNNRLDIKNSIRETTGIDQIAKGGQAAAGTTATEVNAQAQSTGQRIESKARILEKDGLYWMAWILFKLIQLYQTSPVVVEVTGINHDGEMSRTLPSGKELPNNTAIFDPKDYLEDWRPSISLEIDAKNKKQKDMADRRAEYQILIQDPTNNLEEIKKRYYPKMFDLDKEDLDAIITPPAPAPAEPSVLDGLGQPAPGAGAPMAGGAAPLPPSGGMS